jgi:hypothetical protein
MMPMLMLVSYVSLVRNDTQSIFSSIIAFQFTNESNLIDTHKAANCQHPILIS